MKKNIRIALYFASYSDSELNSFAILVLACLKSNPLFPDLPLTLAALGALQLAFQNALTVAATGGVKDTAAKNEARTALIAALRQMAAYVQSLGLTNLSEVLSSGFDTVSQNSAQAPLLTPVFNSLDNSVSGQLQIRLQSVANAAAYQVQYCIGTNAWIEGGIFPSTRKIIIFNLTPGTTYTVRVRAIGGSERYSPWSATTSIMVT